MPKGTLFIISAPSGAGKSSLIKKYMDSYNYDDSCRLSISHTTREPRPGEENHISYHFVSHDEFQELIERDAFFEYAKVFDNYYGTSKEIVLQWLEEGKDVFFDIDWQGARIIKEQIPEAVKIFILPPSIKELHQRLVRRGQDDASVIQKRMAKATGEISHFDEYDYVIINDNFDDSVISLRSIICAKRCELSNIKNKYPDFLENVQKEAKEYEEAWLPCAHALASALAAAKDQTEE